MFPPPTTTAISTPRSDCAVATSSATRWTTAASMPDPVDGSANTSPESLSTTRRYRLALTPARSLLAHLDPDEPADGGLLAQTAQELPDGGLRFPDERLLDQHGVLVEGVQPAVHDLRDGLLRLPLVARELFEHGSF